MPELNPTAYPEINALLRELLANIQSVLDSQMIGFYLEGSLANGGFDEDSDIDFVAVTEQAVTGDQFLALQQMHDRVAMHNTPWAIQLEGSYIAKSALRRHDPNQVMHPNLERGTGERLKIAEHDAGWDIHRYILRERGIILLGPDPKTLIDPVTPDDLRRAARDALAGWAGRFIENPQLLHQRGYQSYVVLSMCRVLYTLVQGDIASKYAAARWMQNQPAQPFTALIERAWESRHYATDPADAADIAETIEMIRFMLEQSQNLSHEN